MAGNKRNVNVVCTEEDFLWLEREAKNGPYQFPSTLARYLLAEIIREKRGGSVDAKSGNTES